MQLKTFSYPVCADWSVDQLPDLLDEDGRVVLLNPEGERLLGWQEQELIGERLLPMIWPASEEQASLHDLVGAGNAHATRKWLSFARTARRSSAMRAANGAIATSASPTDSISLAWMASC